ncbi:MAG: hypothetical protein GY800_04475 [Planctomycetes bacterium]|nr:hypothetical protein [Planctomycetota bacterium]
MRNCSSEKLEYLSREVLSLGHSLYLSVRGDSMWPVVRDGDQVLVEFVDEHGLRKGDIICFSTFNALIVHRLIGTLTPENGQITLLTGGDANWCSYEMIGLDQVMGKVVAIKKGNNEKRLDTPLRELRGLLCAQFSYGL